MLDKTLTNIKMYIAWSLLTGMRSNLQRLLQIKYKKLKILRRFLRAQHFFPDKTTHYSKQRIVLQLLQIMALFGPTGKKSCFKIGSWSKFEANSD